MKGDGTLMHAPRSLRRRRFNTEHLAFHLMLLIPVVLLLIYHLLPIPAGVMMSFQKFQPLKGFFRSKFVGFDNFARLFRMTDTIPAIRNSLIIAFYKIVFNLVVAVVFALLLNEIRHSWLKRAAQTITYLPYFLSWVILSGIFVRFLSPGSAATAPGLMNTILMKIGLIDEPIYFLGSNETFRATIIITDVWKNFGYKSIVYLAALTDIDPTLYEAAEVDGAGRWKQTIHITIPSIAPFIALMTILSIGSILSAGFDQIFNMYNPAVYATGDIIDTLTYRLGLENQQYSLSAAVGLMRSAVSCVLVLLSYKLADKYAGYRVW